MIDDMISPPRRDRRHRDLQRPANPDRLVTHRLRAFRVEGDTVRMVTKGDANDAAERWNVAATARSAALWSTSRARPRAGAAGQPHGPPRADAEILVLGLWVLVDVGASRVRRSRAPPRGGLIDVTAARSADLVAVRVDPRRRSAGFGRCQAGADPLASASKATGSLSIDISLDSGAILSSPDRRPDDRRPVR